MVDMKKNARKHSFSIELKSKDHVRKISVADAKREGVLFEGFLGNLEELSYLEEVTLMIKGANGTLRVDLSEDELRKLLSRKKEKN
ncbi:MAG: hypothetical protein JSV18_07255 [Candidatus Bathyarchaeota archaeon]|nr:MAG: hypothetical protein JSV18_07255 [Candidatus Bathyarchaeota archaeon]